jgi:hypothetical protein
MTVFVERLSSGYWLLSGRGPCNYSQPPDFPCSEEDIRSHAHPGASEEFLREAVAEANRRMST